jgi:hypothetical protein
VAAGPRTLVVTAVSGYCRGDLHVPRIDRVVVRWQRLHAHRFRAVLTVELRSPVEQPSSWVNQEIPGGGTTVVYVCSGVGSSPRAKVRLPQPLDRVQVLDGSTSPPRSIPVQGLS